MKKKKKVGIIFTLSFIILLLSNIDSFGQKVSGTVVDETNSTLPGVTVIIKGTQKGTTTNIDGNYEINVNNPETDVLVFSFTGMEPQEVPVAGQTKINVNMKISAKELDEVVVIGYGTVKRSDLTGAVASVSSEAIVKRGATSALASIQGSVAGVNIAKTSSRPGAGYDILIRGQNSFGNATPLYVVDGIVTDNINFLNPADIVSVDILKDASSTAIYGSRGSSGVLMVTTKSAANVKEGKTVVSYNGYYGTKTPARIPKQYSTRDWLEYRSHAYLVWAPGAGNNGMADWTMSTSTVYMNMWEAARRAYEQDDTDWVDLLTQDGTQQNHYLNAAGNSGKMSFNIGMGYQNEDGIFIKENLKQYSLKASINYKISDKWQVGATTNFGQNEIEFGNSLAYQQITRMSPIFKAYKDNGDLLIQPGLETSMEVLPGDPGVNFTGNTSPLWEIETGKDNLRRYDILASFFLQYSPIAGLDIKTVIQPRYNRNRVGRYTEMNDNMVQRTGFSGNDETFDYTWDNIINYQKSFNQHNFKVTAIHSVFSSMSESINLSTNTLPYDSEWYNLMSGIVVPGNSGTGYSETKMISYLGRLNYDYAGKYLLTASLRYDGSSRLADKWALFPSFAVAWRLSEESFMQADFLSNLKLRFSYGQTGNNNIPPYRTFNGPNTAAVVYYNYGSTASTGFAPGSPVNPALTWERTKETNFGLDFGLFKGRINGIVELYNRLSDGLLMQRRLAVESGVNQMWDNIGSLRNTGIELTLNTVNIQTKDFRWSTSFTFAKNKNEIVSLYGRKEDVIGEQRFIGEPINVIYDYKFDGVFSKAEADAAAGYQLFKNYNPLPGHAKIIDTNLDTLINANDRIILGCSDPKWTAGFSTSIEVKNFDFNLSLIANYGRFVRDQFAANAISQNSRSQMMWADPEDYYYPQGAPRPDWDNPIITQINGVDQITGINFIPAPEENVDAKYPAYGAYQGPYYSAAAMNYREVSFIKIRNISMGYSFNKKLISKVGLSKLRLYVNVLDPFVISDYIGWDPEYTTTTARNGNGPSSITYQFGVNVEF